MRQPAQLVASEDAPAIDSVGADAGKVADFPGDAGVVVGDGAVGRLNVFAVVFVGVVEAAVAFALLGRGVEPGLGELDACGRALVLQAEVLDHFDEVGLLGRGEGGGGGVAVHEIVEDGHCDGAFGFVEEDDGDEEAEGIVA